MKLPEESLGSLEDTTREKRSPSIVKCWSGKDGSFARNYSCDVGLDDTGKPAPPSISTVVFCHLAVEDKWVDSLVVGLRCLCQVLKYRNDCKDFDIDEVEQESEGNILPFYEHSNRRAMGTWRGRMGIIRAMAVIPDEHLLSYSMRHGHGLPDAMILWDLEDPGVPLCRNDFWDPSRSLFKQNLTRLQEACGISASGTEILFACEHGDRVAVVTVQNDEHAAPQLHLHVGTRISETAVSKTPAFMAIWQCAEVAL